MGRYVKGQSGNPKGRPKGATGIKTDLLEVHKKLFSEPILKRDEKGNVIKKIKLTPEQEILAGMLSMFRDKKTPVQVRAKVASELMTYLYTKPVTQIELTEAKSEIPEDPEERQKLVEDLQKELGVFREDVSKED
jgi:hypothetical protein